VLDVVFVGLSILFFVLSVGYVAACDDGVGGVIIPFIGIKAIDVVITALRLA
jgi:hypothetical protein